MSRRPGWGAAIGGAKIELLAATSAVGLTAIGVLYVTKYRILPVYLTDAVTELTLIGDWRNTHLTSPAFAVINALITAG